MMHSRLVRALTRLHDATTRSRVLDVLAPLRPYSMAPPPDVSTVLQAHAEFSVGSTQFREPERALLAALGLDMLLAPSWWSQFVTAVARSTIPQGFAADLAGLCARLEMIETGFPALAAIVATPDLAAAADSDSLVVLVSGQDGQSPSLARIAAALEAVDSLWSVSEDLTGQRGPLQLLGVEPGQTVRLHFDGLAEPLQELRRVMVSVADVVANASQIPADQHPALVPGLLPVMDQILRSGRADATDVKTALETGVRRLLEAGAGVRRELRASAPPVQPSRAAPPAEPVMEAMTLSRHSSQDIANLADVIAEERKQLQKSEPEGRLWQNTGAGPRSMQ